MFPYSFNQKEYKEKVTLRRAANSIGAAYAFIFVFTFFIGLAGSIFALFSASSQEKMAALVSDPIIGCVIQAGLSILMFVPAFLAVIPLAGRKISAVVATKKPKTENFLPFVFIGLAVCQIGEMLSTIFNSALGEIGISAAAPEMTFGNSFIGVLLAVVSVAVVPALVEELAFRGTVLGLLKPFGDGFAVIVSAVLFGLMHGNLVQMPFAFVVGLILGFMTVKTGSIWCAVVVHFINNGLSVGASYLKEAVSDGVFSAIYCCFSMLVLILGALCAILAERRDQDVFKFEENNCTLTETEKHKGFWLAPIIIISIIITFLEVVAVQVVL